MAFKVFISYAHQDQLLRQELDKHLSNLKQQQIISSWHDGNISPGTEWQPHIIEHLNSAEIILLLVSADFMASDFCYSVELRKAIARHNANQAHVIPILLRPTDWEGALFAKLKMLPTNAQAITKWPTLDDAFENVVQGIRQVLSVAHSTIRHSENTFHPEKHSHNTAMQQEKHEIVKRLQEARDTYSALPQIYPYKIDISAIIKCNLDEQRMHFIKGFGGKYKGFFTFTVASTEYTVLKGYVVESLIWELKQRTNRPTDVRHIYPDLESLDSTNIEQGSIYLQDRIMGAFQGKTIKDLFEDNQDNNLVIVLWNANTLPQNFKPIADLFAEKLKEQVKNILHNRCLVLFWANHGPAARKPLKLSVALPTFKQFEVEHIVEWLETALSYQLKDQQMPEQEIEQCRERLIAKIKYHKGRLLGTYESLLEPLELGGMSLD